MEELQITFKSGSFSTARSAHLDVKLIIAHPVGCIIGSESEIAIHWNYCRARVSYMYFRNVMVLWVTIGKLVSSNTGLVYIYMLGRRPFGSIAKL